MNPSSSRSGRVAPQVNFVESRPRRSSYFPPTEFRRTRYEQERVEEVEDEDSEGDREEVIKGLRGYSGLTRDETTTDALNPSHFQMQNEADTNREFSPQLGGETPRYSTRNGLVSDHPMVRYLCRFAYHNSLQAGLCSGVETISSSPLAVLGL